MSQGRCRYIPNPYPDYSFSSSSCPDLTDSGVGEWIKKRMILVIDGIILDDVLGKIGTHDLRGFLYTGPGGVAYALAYASRGLDLGEDRSKRLKNGQKSLMDRQMKEVEIDQSRKSGLLTGYAGLYAAAALMDYDGDPEGFLDRFTDLAPAIKKSGAKGLCAL